MARRKNTTKRLRSFQQTIMCKLTIDEQIERGKELANNPSQVAILQDQIKKLKARELELRMIVRNEEEERDVNCFHLADFETGEVYTVREDTYEKMESRPMTDRELQQRLFDEDEEPAPEVTIEPSTTEDSPAASEAVDETAAPEAEAENEAAPRETASEVTDTSPPRDPGQGEQPPDPDTASSETE